MSEKIRSNSLSKTLEDRLCELLQNNEAVVLAEIIESTGSTPRTAGSRMGIRSNKEIMETIGGGVVEAQVIRAAEKVFQDKKDITKTFHLNKSITDTMDMICGGSLTVSLKYLPATGASVEKLKAFQNQHLKKRKRIILIGAGHVSKETACLTAYTGFETWVMDDREEFANGMRFQDADSITVLDNFKALFQDIEINRNTYIVILTRGHLHDKTVLAQALKTEAGYIGMIGSRKKRQHIYEALLTEGFTEKELEKVYSPVGLSIGAQTPEEIAVSIVAQLIKVRAENP